MKVLGLFLPVLFLLATPAMAVEYQGKNIDGKKLDAKAYYSQTGGVYNPHSAPLTVTIGYYGS